MKCVTQFRAFGYSFYWH